MIKPPLFALPAALCLGLLPPATLGAAEQTYPELVRRLWDMEAVAVLPPAGEQTAQFSSYSRASLHDGNRYVAWDNNKDSDGIIRKEGEDAVIAEMTGPGCIWRIWSATPLEGHVRIYLDGNPEPAVDLPFAGFFDRKNAPFTRPELVYYASRGANNYTPIPYAKSCKIVAAPGWGKYYLIDYTTFPAGTRVPTFRRDLPEADAAALDEANRIFAGRPAQPGGPVPGQKTTAGTQEIPAGAVTEIFSTEGPAALTGLKLRVADLPASPEDRTLLRELVLQITWDEDREPAVWAPLADFFGTAAGANRFQSLVSGLDKDGWWYAHWFMPFGKKARIALRNDSSKAQRIDFEIAQAPLPRPVEDYGRLHVKWHRDALLPEDPDRAIDWTLLKTQGRGRFVGTHLHIWNPRGTWWGEGDEKFFVDGEKFPSTYGTGSEDYFGYAWCDWHLFEQALHGQTISEKNKGHISVHRWHLADSIPFQQSFDGYIEKYFPNTRPTLYAATAYWYLSAGGTDPYQPVSVADRAGYWQNYQPPAGVPGALEAEEIPVTVSSGKARVQFGDRFAGRVQWSADAQLCWSEGRPGERMDLAIQSAKPGKYRVLARFTKAADYGIIQPSWDGAKIGDPIDLRAAHVEATGEIPLGEYDLTAGNHTLSFELLPGASEAAPRVGLDYVRLEEAQ